MGRQVPFGDILRDAREREGLDLNTAARKLHIRPDILRAIEDSDFARMPPRGYTRNMVNAYARLVGLNASQMSSLYADQAYAYEVGRSRSDELRLDGRARSSSSSRPSSNRPRSAAGGAGRSQGTHNGRTASGRGIYDDRTDMQGRAYSTRFAGSSQGRGNNAYRNVYAGGSAAPVASKLPFILIGIIVLLILIIVLVLLFGNKGPAETDVPADVHIAGLTNTANPTQGDTASPDAAAQAAQQAAAKPKVEEPPTKAVFTYEVLDGKQAYIEVKVGDTTSYETASIIDGPAEKSYDVTSTLTFATPAPDNVVLTLDGETVQPTEMGQGTGVYQYKVNFSDILDKWKEDHPEATEDDDGDDDGAKGAGSEDGASSGSDSGTTDSGQNGSSSGQ